MHANHIPTSGFARSIMTRRWEPGRHSGGNGDVKSGNYRRKKRPESALFEEARELRRGIADDSPDPDTRHELRRIGVAI